MIALFPKPYDDELLYSVLARYFVQCGYSVYISAATDLFEKPATIPDIDLINKLDPDVVNALTAYKPMKNIILEHTMFPYYGRFMESAKRQQALTAMITMQNNVHYLLPIPKTSQQRYLRYCLICAKADRQKFGEAYWHRSHQLLNVNVCPLHHTKLIDSNITFSKKCSPTLTTAEAIITDDSTTEYSANDTENRLVEYINKIFQNDINFDNRIKAGDYLHSKMANTPYRSARGEQRNISLLYADFADYYKGLQIPELFNVQKILTNNRVNFYEICMLAMFLNVSPEELTNMTLPEQTQEQLFDEMVFKLHEQGLKYPAIAKQLNASLDTVKVIGEGRKGKYHKSNAKNIKCGAKPLDWRERDILTLPKVKKAIVELQGDGHQRPQKVSLYRIEKLVGLKSKQINNMPLCKAEIEKNIESQQEYWAKEIIWAANTLIAGSRPLLWRSLRDLTNMRKRDFQACSIYLDKYSEDRELIEKIKALLV